MYNLKIIFYILASAICAIQVYQSVEKYFQRPVIIQESSTSSSRIEKPYTQVCLKDFYNFNKGSEFGYNWMSNFLAGRISNSTRQTWKGKNGSSTFENLLEALYNKDFNQVSVTSPHQLLYVFGRGFCLETKSVLKKQKVKSYSKHVRLYIVHRSTDTQIIRDQTPLIFGPTSNSTFDYKVYKLFYEVLDNSIFEGTECVDYRKEKLTYGECNYKALKDHIFSSYNCYPPWIQQTDGNQCENNQNRNIKFKENNTILEDLRSLNSGIMPDTIQQCQKPCYQVKVRSEEVWMTSGWKDYASLEIHDNDDNLPIHKAIYSFDIFMLTVELGSALGLWLGLSAISFLDFGLLFWLKISRGIGFLADLIKKFRLKDQS